MAEGSKTKFIREALDRAVELPVPQLSSEEFERVFNIKLTEEEIKKLTLGELMVRQLVLKACTGNDRSIEETLDRLLGKPVQTTESISKSYSYHDLLVQLLEEDVTEKKALRGPVIDAVLNAPPRAITADPLADFL